MVRPALGALALEHERVRTWRIRNRDRSLRRNDGAHVRGAHAPGPRRRRAYRTPAATKTTITAASASRYATNQLSECPRRKRTMNATAASPDTHERANPKA